MKQCGWLSPERAARVTREATDQAAVTLAAQAVRRDGALGARRLVEHLRAAGRLTPALMLRAILSGNLALFEAAVSALSDLPMARVTGLVRGASGLGFAALYARAGLPMPLLPIFEAAVRAARHHDETSAGAGPSLRRSLIGRVLTACAADRDPELGKAVALLRGLEAQAARDEARSFTLELGRERTVPALPPPSPRDRPLSLQSAA